MAKAEEMSFKTMDVPTREAAVSCFQEASRTTNKLSPKAARGAKKEKILTSTEYQETSACSKDSSFNLGSIMTIPKIKQNGSIMRIIIKVLAVKA